MEGGTAADGCGLGRKKRSFFCLISRWMFSFPLHFPRLSSLLLGEELLRAKSFPLWGCSIHLAQTPAALRVSVLVARGGREPPHNEGMTVRGRGREEEYSIEVSVYRSGPEASVNGQTPAGLLHLCLCLFPLNCSPPPSGSSLLTFKPNGSSPFMWLVCAHRP